MRCPYCQDLANRVIDSRLGRDGAEIEGMRRALLSLHETPEGEALAADLRILRFSPADEEAISEARRLHRGGENDTGP